MDFNRIHSLLRKTVPWMLFTNRCPYCGRSMSMNKTLCEECEQTLPIISGERCKYCGAEKSRCNCKKHKRAFEAIVAPFYYENSIKKSILNLKFNSEDFIAKTLAKDMAETVNKSYKDISFDFICYVPFTVSQGLNRIYNPSELLAYNLSEELGIPVQRVMVKLFNTKPQHNMKYSERVGNVFGIYDVNDDVNLKGKTILLVDDVKTSGATLNECASILKIRGAEKVYCVVSAVAGTKLQEDKKE